MEMLALAAVIGVGVGVVVGALGAGGGILAVPVLVYLLGQEPHAATASSLVIVGVTAAVSIIHHARRGTVQWRRGAVFAVLSAAGAVAGSRASVLVPSPVLMGLFAALLAVVSAAMLRRGLRARATERAAGSAAAAPPAASAAETGSSGLSWWMLLGTATVTGALTGFFGVGGGFIVVPMLVLALRLPMRQAAGTSLLVMIVATAVSLLSRLSTPLHVDWPLTVVFAAGSMLGGMAGGPVSERARASTLTLIFATLLALVAAGTVAGSLLGA